LRFLNSNSYICFHMCTAIFYYIVKMNHNKVCGQKYWVVQYSRGTFLGFEMQWRVHTFSWEWSVSKISKRENTSFSANKHSTTLWFTSALCAESPSPHSCYGHMSSCLCDMMKRHRLWNLTDLPSDPALLLSRRVTLESDP
jgi:hypothetical protein